MEKMVDIRDEHGNPIKLTDGDGYPVFLTDEYGNPMRLIGVATRLATTLGSLMLGGELGSVSEDDDRGFASYVKGTAAWPGGGHGNTEREHNVRSTSSGSSSSEEDDEQGGRRRKKKKDKKKKGLTQKIREKLTGGKHKDNHSQTPPSTPTAAVANKNTAKTVVERKHPNEHEKKGVTAPP